MVQMHGGIIILCKNSEQPIVYTVITCNVSVYVGRLHKDTITLLHLHLVSKDTCMHFDEIIALDY